MSFQKMQQIDGGYYIISKKPFSPSNHSFKDGTVKTVFEFAYDMTFGEKGEHRDHRSGGSYNRHKGEIFANTFQGKLAECAVCNLFYKKDSTVKPDFSTYELGKWDSVDIVVNNKKISIKSTKAIGNLLLLETKDWDNQGRYLPNVEGNDPRSGIYDYTIMVRIDPACEEKFLHSGVLYDDKCEKTVLEEIVYSKEWKYDYAGYITYDDLRMIITSGNYIIRESDLLNGTTRMDADNYYVQAGDMRDCTELVEQIYGK